MLVENGGGETAGGNIEGKDLHSLFTACPPNLLRITARTLCANPSWSLDSIRCSSDAVITGIATFISMASLTIQRPSHESPTSGAIPPRSRFSDSAWDVRSSSQERTTLP